MEQPNVSHDGNVNDNQDSQRHRRPRTEPISSHADLPKTKLALNQRTNSLTTPWSQQSHPYSLVPTESDLFSRPRNVSRTCPHCTLPVTVLGIASMTRILARILNYGSRILINPNYRRETNVPSITVSLNRPEFFSQSQLRSSLASD